jgi:hypothetical protein
VLTFDPIEGILDTSTGEHNMTTIKFPQELTNKVAELLLIHIDKMEKEGADEDQVEVGIDEWFEELKATVRSKV